MSGQIKLTTEQILNLCEFAGIAVDKDKSSFSEEKDYLETEYVIAQNEYGAVAYLDEYPEEGAYPLSGIPHIMKDTGAKTDLHREEAADRWEALFISARIRFIGSARLGKPDGQVLCIEFHSDHEGEIDDRTKRETELSKERLMKYTSTLLGKGPEPDPHFWG
jgi:hypothetical protein